jgi:hypothetical protein
MSMSVGEGISSMRNACLLACGLLLAAVSVNAQSSPNRFTASSGAWSSSQDGQIQIADGSVPSSAALPSAPAPEGSAAAAQSDDENTYHGWHGHDVVHRLTFEGGGGFSAPAGDKAYITWGGGFLVGGGVNINRNLAALIEYQFLDNKLPGAIIAEAGATGGHVHIWSFTIAPMYSLFPKSSNDLYIVGGGGFYRKVTSFTDVEPTEFCAFYYCGIGYAPQTVGHFSSNQGGFNIGGGYQHRFGGLYGEGRTRFFAEVRYLDVLSPAVTTQPNGLGTTSVAAGTKLIPVTLGFRW